MSHGDQVNILPKNFKNFGFSQTCTNAIMGDEENKLYGIQFHPEVRHSINGLKFLRNFIFNICKIEPN
jgi:GMP synthase (glutamine-hydrolysing)